MPSFKEEYRQENADMMRQEVSDWKERVLRVEEPFIKTKEQKAKEEAEFSRECLENFNRMAHENPEWHMEMMARELERETLCHINKMPFEPGWKNGLPGYWNYRQENAEHWILSKRERLPNE